MYYCRGKASHQALPGALILQEADFSVFTPLLLPLFLASSLGSLSISKGVAAPGSSFYLPPGGKGLSSSIVATNSWGGGGGWSGGLRHICTLESVTVSRRGHMGPALLANEGSLVLEGGKGPIPPNHMR